MPAELRRLTTEDAAAWRALRLRAVTEEPLSFLVTVEEEARVPLEEVRARFRERWSGPDEAVFGVFVDSVLVGNAGIYRDHWQKARHKAWLWGMYVAPEARGQGWGRRLVEAILAHAERMPGIRQVLLIVVADNAGARELYRRCGFVTYAREPHSMMIGDRLYDEEAMVCWLHDSGPASAGESARPDRAHP